MKNFSDIQQFISTFSSRLGKEDMVSEIRDSLSAMKKTAVASNNQIEAKAIWILEQALDSQEFYLQAFKQMKAGKYYDAWCSLEQCEITLDFLSDHYKVGDDEIYSLSFVSKHVLQYQLLYPYKLFFSPEFIEKEKQCNICGATLSIRNSCGHEVGQIYNGEMCCRIVKSCELLGMALVPNPVQKSSVPFSFDPKADKPIDHYNYFRVRYVIDRLVSPFDGWSIRKKGTVGANDAML